MKTYITRAIAAIVVAGILALNPFNAEAAHHRAATTEPRPVVQRADYCTNLPGNQGWENNAGWNPNGTWTFDHDTAFFYDCFWV